MRTYLANVGLVLFQMTAATPTPTPASTSPAPESGGFGSFLWLMLGLVIGIVIGLLLAKAFGRSQSKAKEFAEENQITTLGIDTAPRVVRKVTPRGKSCPVCNSTYTDEALIYCVSDGATLVGAKGSAVNDAGATLLNRDLPPTRAYGPNKSTS